VKRIYSDYQSLAADPDIVAMYIASTDSLYVENSKPCLENGKHVASETPLGVNAEPAKILMALAQGLIGEVQTVKAHFSTFG